MEKCNWKKCKRKARWEIGFSAIIQNDSSGFLCGDDVAFTQLFCDKHFIELNGCGNTIEFRQIKEEKWKDFDEYDNPFLLKDLVRNSYKLYISDKLKFNKITNFLKNNHLKIIKKCQ